MKTVEQIRIDRLFKTLLSDKIGTEEAFTLWLVRAEDCVSLAHGHESPFLPLLEGEKQKGDFTDLETRVKRARNVLSAAQKHVSISSEKAEEDGDLKKEAEYAVHKAALRSPWLKAAAAILIAAAGFTFTGTLKLNNLSLDLENRIQKAMEARKQGLTDAAAAALSSLERVRQVEETALTNRAGELSKRLQEQLISAESNQIQKIEEVGSAQIKKLSGDNAPDILSVAKRIEGRLQGFEDRVGRAERRQATVETNLGGLEGLSDRLDVTTISELKRLAPHDRILTWATQAVAALALFLSCWNLRRKSF
jgi:hypothetical protein